MCSTNTQDVPYILSHKVDPQAPPIPPSQSIVIVPHVPQRLDQGAQSSSNYHNRALSFSLTHSLTHSSPSSSTLSNSFSYSISRNPKPHSLSPPLLPQENHPYNISFGLSLSTHETYFVHTLCSREVFTKLLRPHHDRRKLLKRILTTYPVLP